MGQHKNNKTAIAYAEGKVAPNPPRETKAERDRRLREQVRRILFRKIRGESGINMEENGEVKV